MDPKYYPSAMADRVEGKVRLRAVVRTDGRVEDVVLLEKLDERLDLPEKPPSTPKARGLGSLGAAGNLAGLPALSLPCGFAGGLPVALQLVGRPWNENNILAIGVEFQRRTDWHRRRPPA